ncbi:hypothetical protein PG997_005449 [Apiospora hydei]|uniref:Uncharacterized protein n=1 Tax=Apiospora hydei TaxID=1337664 RepID=A0ABR1X4Z9_9PEZI
MKTEKKIGVSIVFAIGLLAYSIGMCFGAAELTCGFLTITAPSLPQAISSIKISKPTSMLNFGYIGKRTKAASHAGRYHEVENIENAVARVD